MNDIENNGESIDIIENNGESIDIIENNGEGMSNNDGAQTLVEGRASVETDKAVSATEVRDEKGSLKILMGMDVYLPDVDGVVNCMHNYCLCLDTANKITAIAPSHKEQDKVKTPYKLLRCKSIYVPILRDYYGRPSHDKRFKEEVMSEHYDIVHTHSPFRMAKFAVQVARRQGIPAVITFHSNIKPIIKSYAKFNWLTDIILKKIGSIYNKYDKVFVCSELVAEQVRECGYTGEITLLPFGTDLPHLSNEEIERNKTLANEKFNLQPDELVFLYVGRVMPLKRIDFTLDALKILKEKGLKFKFFIVGKGSGMKQLTKYAEELGFTQDEVIFTGFLARELLPLINSRADLFLFPSLYDNFGLVKVEAAAYNTAGVFIEGSCAGDNVTDNFNGFLSKNTAESFANAIERAIDDRTNLNNVGKRAGETLYISWEECSRLLKEEYVKIIAEYKEKNQ